MTIIGTTVHGEPVEVHRGTICDHPPGWGTGRYCVTVSGEVVGSASGRRYWPTYAQAATLGMSLVPRHRRVSDYNGLAGSLEHWQSVVAMNESAASNWADA